MARYDQFRGQVEKLIEKMPINDGRIPSAAVELLDPKKQKPKATWGERTRFVTKARTGGTPGTKIKTGDESLDYVHSNLLEEGWFTTARWHSGVGIPILKIQQAGSPDSGLGAADLYKLYVEDRLTSLVRSMVAQLLTGIDSTNGGLFSNFLTLNGEVTWEAFPASSEHGVLDPRAKALQDYTVHALPSVAAANGLPGWWNPSGEITSWMNNGEMVIRQVLSDAAINGGESKTPRLGFSDSKGFANIVRSLRDRTVFVNTTPTGGQKSAPIQHLDAVEYHGCMIYRETVIDENISQFSNGVRGVLMAVNPDTIESYRYQAPNVGGSKIPQNNFEVNAVNGTGLVQGKDQLAWDIFIQMGCVCLNRRGNAFIKGAANR